jgi:REP element-mobilizing transposase RayT
MLHAKEYAEFVTITCLEWKNILSSDRAKDIIIESLEYLSSAHRVRVFAFVIMSNHIHLIWQMLGDSRREDVRRDFLKYTGQQIIRYLRKEDPSLLDQLRVNASDRKYQVWERTKTL